MDKTVLWFGVTVENLLAEMIEVGKERQPKYTLDEILQPSFRAPRPMPPIRKQASKGGLSALLALGGGAVRQWTYIGPEAKPT